MAIKKNENMQSELEKGDVSLVLVYYEGRRLKLSDEICSNNFCDSIQMEYQQTQWMVSQLRDFHEFFSHSKCTIKLWQSLFSLI